ncbi:hypothetical protein E2562_009096 [Oryza meyeriana var. granulata]|uniref:Uncharacterized protein n=1 Tax=Oryza meyeriana var. granulata TaxID=110450 RepID=A0A6G1D2X8_9ORYZ|nr:hypothetical protein E2562_009096 [Oryza meyeriana var. granulata]
MVNVSKLEGGPSQQQPLRSPVTPRRTSQTLTLSKVESASIADKCEIRFDAQWIGFIPFQDASGGLRDRADRNAVDGLEAKVNAQASKFGASPPPLDFFDYLVLGEGEQHEVLVEVMNSFSYVCDFFVTESIVNCMLSAIKKEGELELPFGGDAAEVCLNLLAA